MHELEAVIAVKAVKAAEVGLEKVEKEGESLPVESPRRRRGEVEAGAVVAAVVTVEVSLVFGPVVKLGPAAVVAVVAVERKGVWMREVTQEA